jgi:TolB-like protein
LKVKDTAGLALRFFISFSLKGDFHETVYPPPPPPCFRCPLVLSPSRKSRNILFITLLQITVHGFAQQPVTLDTAIDNAVMYLGNSVPGESKIAVLNITSQYERLSNYIIEELISTLVNHRKFTIVDRRTLELIQQEINFQLSGEVSDESIQSIGQKLGAQTIIAGSIEPIGGIYRFRIRAVSVLTAQIQGQQGYDVIPDTKIAELTGQTPITSLETVSTPPREWYDDWTSNWLYLGVRPFVFNVISSRAEELFLEQGVTDSDIDTGYGYMSAFQVSLQIFKYFAIQMDFIFNWHSNIPIFKSYDHGMKGMTISGMTIPIFAKLTFRPSIFSIQPFAGIYFNIPWVIRLSEYEYKYKYDTDEFHKINISIPSTGFSCGARFGIGVGNYEVVFIDLRYNADFRPVTANNYFGKKGNLLSSSSFSISFGMEVGLIKR